METEKTKVVSCRVPEKLAYLIQKICELDLHVNPADFIRDAIREKIQRDYFELAKQILQEPIRKVVEK